MLHRESRQTATEWPGLEQLKILDSPEVVFLDHGEERRCDLAGGGQEIDFHRRSMVLQGGRPKLQILELGDWSVLGSDLRDVLDQSEMFLNSPRRLPIRFAEVVGTARLELGKDHPV